VLEESSRHRQWPRIFQKRQSLTNGKRRKGKGRTKAHKREIDKKGRRRRGKGGKLKRRNGVPEKKRFQDRGTALKGILNRLRGRNRQESRDRGKGKRWKEKTLKDQLGKIRGGLPS